MSFDDAEAKGTSEGSGGVGSGRATVIARRAFTSLAPLVLVLAVWEMSARTGFLNPNFFPPPTEIAVKYHEMTVTGELIPHVLVSLKRVFVAFFVGSSLGITVGLVMGWSRFVRSLLDPVISALYPLPKVVLLPIIFIIFGVNEVSRIVAMALAVFLLVVINTMGGVQQIDKIYFEIARDNNASNFAMFKDVILPGSLPHIFTGLSLGIGLTFILIVVIEMVAAEQGIGFVIWDSWQLFTIERMYVAVVTINILGIVLINGVDWIGKLLMPWQR